MVSRVESLGCDEVHKVHTHITAVQSIFQAQQIFQGLFIGFPGSLWSRFGQHRFGHVGQAAAGCYHHPSRTSKAPRTVKLWDVVSPAGTTIAHMLTLAQHITTCLIFRVWMVRHLNSWHHSFASARATLGSRLPMDTSCRLLRLDENVVKSTGSY